MAEAAADPLRSRLRWQCRRGMRELDVLLERWLALDWDAATAMQREQFEALLGYSDPELQAWLLTGEPAPQLAELITAIRRTRPIMSAS